MLLPTQDVVKTVTDLRESTVDVLKDLKRKGSLYIFNRSDLEGVMISVHEYRRICELLEDRQDELEAATLAQEDRGETVSLDEVMNTYGKSV